MESITNRGWQSEWTGYFAVTWWLFVVACCATLPAETAEETLGTSRQVGCTLLQTDLPGGRHANIRTMRAHIIGIDDGKSRTLGEELASDENTWTQFAGWSPNGQIAIVAQGWQDPENARWEEEHKTFRMDSGKWRLDSYLIDVKTGHAFNVTGVDRVSHYNAGVFFVKSESRLGFTALVDGNSIPYMMDMNGRHKHPVADRNGGFVYGYSGSPDGKHISFHENYQIYIANADGSEKRHIKTGNPFDFGPTWSPRGEWLLFVSGVHGNCNPYVVRPDGTGLRKLADRNGYQGWILFLDVADFHEGSSDVPVWSADGANVFFTGKVGDSVELFQVALEGDVKQLTHSHAETLHYHPVPSPDGKQLMYGSKRQGVRQLFVMDLTSHVERQITQLEVGHAAMWPHWQPWRNLQE